MMLRTNLLRTSARQLNLLSNSLRGEKTLTIVLIICYTKDVNLLHVSNALFMVILFASSKNDLILKYV